jgi:hypothetical protein
MYTKISKAMAAGTTITTQLFFKTMASNLSQVTQKLCGMCIAYLKNLLLSYFFTN